MVGLTLYGIACVLWAIFCIRMQVKLGYPKGKYNSLWIVFFVNLIAMPITMIIAIVRVPTEYKKRK